MICYGVTQDGNEWRQEIYETSSGTANKRARQIRKLGLIAICGTLGPQVTKVGLVWRTVVAIYPTDEVSLDVVPEVTVVDI